VSANRDPSEHDLANERDVAEHIARHCGWQLRSFGAQYSPIDYYAVDGQRVAAVIEIKCRTHAHDAYPTVFFSWRKWIVLTLTAAGLCCTALFVVRFRDGDRWINLDDVDPRWHEVSGWAVPRAPNDVEPLIHVPVADMEPIP
jgi:hypothetical protein